jgi:hypothetical protein
MYRQQDDKGLMVYQVVSCISSELHFPDFFLLFFGGLAVNAMSCHWPCL